MTEAVTDDPTWGGPDMDLIERVSKAHQAPSFGDLSEEESDAIRERIIAGRTFSNLDPADQAFIVRCEGEVDAGLSVTMQRYSAPDWAAEDAAVEAGDDEAKGFDFAEDDDDPAGDLPDADADGWVGV